ncbi:MAG: YceI family protein [Planctomycetes bacterium]|nr:YceI family protein [Planctomycetota bacterium]
MRSKQLITAAIVLSAAALASPFVLSAPKAAWSAPESATWAGDTVHTFVLFKIKHMGTSWSWGRFNDFTVSVQGDAATGAVSSVEFAVKAESIDTGNANRDKHLRSPDFLNTKQFESITFKSTGVKTIDADTAEVTGDLSLHGETKPITIKLVKTGSGEMKGTPLVGYETTFTIKRSDYGMTQMLPGAGDEVTLTIATELAKK